MADVIARILAYAYAAWRRRGYAIAVAWLVCLGGWAAVAVMPDSYRSSALVNVDTASVLQPLLRGLTIELDLQAEVGLMQRTLLSRPNVEKVVRATDLDLTAKTSSDTERLIRDLTGRIEVQRRGQDLFEIGFRDKDPQLAHDVVQELLTIFVENNLGQNRGDMDAARRFIEDQIKLYEDRLAEADRGIAEFKRKNLGLLPGQNNQLRSFEAIQAKMAQLETDLRDARVRRETLRRELQDIPQFFPTENAFGAGPPTNTAVEILRVQADLEKLRSQYTEKHPDVVVAQRQLEGLLERQRQEFEAVATFADSIDSKTGSSGGTGASNPIYEQIKIQLVQAEANIATLDDRIAQAREELDEARKLAARGPELEVELARLNRDYAVLMGSYNQLLASRETEQISRARDVQAENIRFRIMDPPTVAAIPSGPNRLLLLALVLAMGIGSGTGFAVLLAFSSETFSSVAELRTAIGVPVLGSVSTVDLAGYGLWALGKSATFWTMTVMLFAAFAALWFVESRVGLSQVVSSELVSRLPSAWLRRLPIF